MGLFDRFSGDGDDGSEDADGDRDGTGGEGGESATVVDVTGGRWPPDQFAGALPAEGSGDPDPSAFADYADHIAETAAEHPLSDHHLDVTPATLDDLDGYAHNLGGEVPSAQYLRVDGVTAHDDADEARVLRFVAAVLGTYYGEVLVRDGGRWAEVDGHWYVWHRGKRVDPFRVGLEAYLADDRGFGSDYAERTG